MIKDEWRVRASDIVYEDESLIAVNKPYGVPSQATLDPQRDHAYWAVRRYLSNREGREVYVGLHHRLDALTTGVLLMTKSRAVNAAVSEQFQKHLLEKTYEAVCVSRLSLDDAAFRLGCGWRIDLPIGEIPGKMKRYGVEGRGRKPAQTDVACEAVVGVRGLVVGQFACCPRTGRTHQIRVHMAALGLGIVGDPLYGTVYRELKTADPGRMMLHARRIRMKHPVDGGELEIEAPVPDIFASFLERCRRLGRASGLS